jgi:hypothetical protein
MPPEYEAAVDSLERSRTSVFVLDAADATYHTLEQGLRWIADDTGGRYEKTDLFPEVALDLMAETLAGQYLVSYRPPAGAVGAKVRVELREPGLGRIVAPRRVARR